MNKNLLCIIILFAGLTPCLSSSSLTSWKAPLLNPGQLLFESRFQSEKAADDYIYGLYDQTLLGSLQLGLTRQLQLNLSSIYNLPTQETALGHYENADGVQHDRLFNLRGELQLRPRNDLELVLIVQHADTTDTDTFISQRVNDSNSYTHSFQKFGIQGHWFSHQPGDPETLTHPQDVYNRPLLDPGQWRISSELSWTQRTIKNEYSYNDDFPYWTQDWDQEKANYWQLTLGTGVGLRNQLQLEADISFILPYSSTETGSIKSEDNNREWNNTLPYDLACSYRIKGTYSPSHPFRVSAEYRMKTMISGYSLTTPLHSLQLGGSFISGTDHQIPLNASLDTLSGPLLDKNKIKLDLFTVFYPSSLNNWMYQSRLSYGLLRNLQIGAAWKQLFYEEPQAHGRYETRSITRLSLDLIARVGSGLEVYLILKPLGTDIDLSPSQGTPSWYQEVFHEAESWINPIPEITKFSAGFRLFF